MSDPPSLTFSSNNQQNSLFVGKVLVDFTARVFDK
jgi:hypothetical protein